jgi:hypothetical protein
MAFRLTDWTMGFPDLTDVSSVAKVNPGTITTFSGDAGEGEGKFIYLQGVASTAAFDACVYSSTTYITTRAVAASRGAVVIAQAAIGANQFGWYQMSGRATVNAVAAAAGGLCYLTATAGQIDNAVVATQGIDGMRTASAKGTPTAATCFVQMREAFANNQG